ncbi:hypothetical protein CsSME_00053008 [Camellia sinensis var. sinensis]
MRMLIQPNLVRPNKHSLNFNGVVGRNGLAGVGVVAQDFRGNVLASCTEQILYFNDVDHVEALGALRASIIVKDLGSSSVHIEGDSFTVVNLVKSDEADLSSIGSVSECVRSNLVGTQNWVIGHVKCSGNQSGALSCQVGSQ